MYHDPKFWLAISFLLFCGLILKYVWPILVRAIDDKSKAIAAEIETAVQLKNKADLLLIDAEKYQQYIIEYSEKLIADARIEANQIITNAKNAVETEIAKKLELTRKRIEQEEERVVREVKNRIINEAIAVLTGKLPANKDKKSTDFVIETAISDLSKIIN